MLLGAARTRKRASHGRVRLTPELRSTPDVIHRSDKPRPRHEVSTALLHVLWPIYRYSQHRHAYVLRLVGNFVGPVLVERREHWTPLGPRPH